MRHGGRSRARIASLVAASKLDGVARFAYLAAAGEATAAGRPAARIGELLPWKFQPPST
jgi:uncharacterized protein YfiM (DUF2279 family)